MKKLFVLLLLLFAFACRKEVDPATEAEWQRGCRESLSEADTYKRLIGKWKLVATGCAECFDPGIHPTADAETLSISKDRLITVYEKGLVKESLKFNLTTTTTSPGFFQLETKPTPSHSHTYGIVEFCKGSLVFKNSYTDGSDYYYEKIR